MLREEVVTIDCAEHRLVGVFHPEAPNGIGIGVVIVVGGPQYRVGSHRQFVTSARYLARAGVAVLRFDARGMGDSSGEASGFEHLAEDIDAAVAEMRHRRPDFKLVLLGLCDGASAILLTERARHASDGMVLINPWVRTPALAASVVARHYYLGRFAQREFWHKLFSLRVNPLKSLLELATTLRTARSGDDLTKGRTYVDAMIDALDRTRAPVLFALSGDDLTAKEFDTLSETHARLKSTMTRANTSVVRLPGADHTFSRREDLDRFNEQALAWLTRAVRP